MASLVDSPLPLDSPPLNNTLPPAPRLQPQAPPSLPSTPGLDIPGAFPREDSASFAVESRPAPRQKSSQTSRARSYLPPGVASYLSGAKAFSLPSTEKEGVMPGEHHDGVGPLPGSISETSVAKLPDERFESAGQPGPSVHPLATGVAAPSLPSQETEGVRPGERHGGVDLPLPSSSSETSVAKLPDERPRPQGAAVDAPGIVDLGTQVHRNADDRDDPSRVRRESKEVFEGADAEDIPADSKFKEEVAAAEEKKGFERKRESYRSAEERLGTGAAGVPTQRKGRSSSDSDASNHKKASVMNKVKGEMKVLLGKASRNKEKVEEGEKLKQGLD
ncbi:hypothetical protein F5148DRAFT_1337750 [Russula earlei]|uniref:Uncharacterized protein n=1 Tax=Russula earlei TaxID=71964 RepID=A0ACC0UFB2_9AGAM|nr:hypothetical protein F5148DRAFT_1337750 [Russula earlei]